MAHSYTPGLTVTDRMVVRKKRVLPIPGTVRVRTGDQVKPDTVVAVTELPGKVHVINVANLLGVAPDEVQEYLTKRAGDPVKADEVIAETHPFIKWFKTEVRSPINGQLESASSVTGQVLLREPPRALELRGYIDGEVVEVHPKEGITVETSCSLVQGIFGIGGEAWGEITMAVSAPGDSMTPRQLTPEMKGKIVVCGAFLGADSMARAREIGVAGLIVGGIHDKDLRDLLGYDLGVAITGTERVGFTLMLTEGFGTIPMARKTFQLLSDHAGQQASISGATQIRAGVIRPELIIPRSRQSREASTPATTASSPGGLRLGDQVRIIRDPLFGKIGRVAALPPELKEIETESRVRVLEVEFPDRSSAVIPRANVELIEG
jgi:hypothetical protein